MNDTQLVRVLRALRAVGSRGLTATDFIRQPTFDGGAPITRLAARIDELRDAGHHIEGRGRRDACTVYVLVDVAAGPAAAHTPHADGAPPCAERGTGREVDRTDVAGPWAQTWLCPRCAYAVVDGPTCPRGHDAVFGWHGDFRPDAPWAVAERAQQEAIAA